MDTLNPNKTSWVHQRIVVNLTTTPAYRIYLSCSLHTSRTNESSDRQGISHYVQRSVTHTGWNHTDRNQSWGSSQALRRLERTRIELTKHRPWSQNQPMAAPCWIWKHYRNQRLQWSNNPDLHRRDKGSRGVGAGVAIFSSNKPTARYKFKLDHRCSNNQAEQLAILKAMELTNHIETADNAPPHDRNIHRQQNNHWLSKRRK